MLTMKPRIADVLKGYSNLLMQSRAQDVTYGRQQPSQEQHRVSILSKMIEEKGYWLQMADYISIFDVTIRVRKLPTERLNALLSTPVSQMEVDFLKHIDIEKMATLFDMFFTKHSTVDYTLPVRRLVA